MKTRLLLVAVALGSSLWAETSDPPGAEKVIKVVHVHGNARALADMSGFGSGATVQGSDQLRAVVIKGLPPDVANVVRTIQELDTTNGAELSGKNIELVFYVVSGTMDPVAGMPDTGADLLAPVYKQLRAVFPYKNYQLLSTMLMRSGQNSQASTSGMMKSPQNTTMPALYSIRYDAATVSADTQPSIHLAKFKFEGKIPSNTGPSGSTAFQQVTIGIETNVDLREGQKIVIGTSNVETGSATLFLVVTARMVQ
jgi:hypothetical protein